MVHPWRARPRQACHSSFTHTGGWANVRFFFRELARGSQACTATFMFDPSMSALPIIETLKSESVRLFTHQWERELGLDRREID